MLSKVPNLKTTILLKLSLPCPLQKHKTKNGLYFHFGMHVFMYQWIVWKEPIGSENKETPETRKMQGLAKPGNEVSSKAPCSDLTLISFWLT